jgi:hypothetical protein
MSYGGCKIATIPMRIICVVIMIASAFDLTVLRLLPWSRSEFTDQVSGYPNIFTVRCGLYGTLIATLFQTSASITTATSFTNTSVLAFLVVSLINLLTAMLLVVMFIQIAFSGTMKVNIIHYYKKENGEFEIQLRAITTSSEKHIDSDSDINHSVVMNDIELGPLHTPSTEAAADDVMIENKIQDHSETVSPLLTESTAAPETAAATETVIEKSAQKEPPTAAAAENEVILDERGILFNTSIKYADETLRILRDQITKDGQSIQSVYFIFLICVYFVLCLYSFWSYCALGYVFQSILLLYLKLSVL